MSAEFGNSVCLHSKRGQAAVEDVDDCAAMPPKAEQAEPGDRVYLRLETGQPDSGYLQPKAKLASEETELDDSVCLQTKKGQLAVEVRLLSGEHIDVNFHCCSTVADVRDVVATAMHTMPVAVRLYLDDGLLQGMELLSGYAEAEKAIEFLAVVDQTIPDAVVALYTLRCAIDSYLDSCDSDGDEGRLMMNVNSCFEHFWESYCLLRDSAGDVDWTQFENPYDAQSMFVNELRRIRWQVCSSGGCEPPLGCVEFLQNASGDVAWSTWGTTHDSCSKRYHAVERLTMRQHAGRPEKTRRGEAVEQHKSKTQRDAKNTRNGKGHRKAREQWHDFGG